MIGKASSSSGNFCSAPTWSHHTTELSQPQHLSFHNITEPLQPLHLSFHNITEPLQPLNLSFHNTTAITTPTSVIPQHNCHYNPYICHPTTQQNHNHHNLYICHSTTQKSHHNPYICHPSTQQPLQPSHNTTQSLQSLHLSSHHTTKPSQTSTYAIPPHNRAITNLYIYYPTTQQMQTVTTEFHLLQPMAMVPTL